MALCDTGCIVEQKQETKESSFCVEVYLRDGRKSCVVCETEEKARELTGSVFLNGHARLFVNAQTLEYYPLWMIVKIKIVGPFTTSWPQVWKGT